MGRGLLGGLGGFDLTPSVLSSGFTYRGQGDLVTWLIKGITRVSIWFIGAKSP